MRTFTIIFKLSRWYFSSNQALKKIMSWKMSHFLMIGNIHEISQPNHKLKCTNLGYNLLVISLLGCKLLILLKNLKANCDISCKFVAGP